MCGAEVCRTADRAWNHRASPLYPCLSFFHAARDGRYVRAGDWALDTGYGVLLTWRGAPAPRPAEASEVAAWLDRARNFVRAWKAARADETHGLQGAALSNDSLPARSGFVKMAENHFAEASGCAQGEQFALWTFDQLAQRIAARPSP